MYKVRLLTDQESKEIANQTYQKIIEYLRIEGFNLKKFKPGKPLGENRTPTGTLTIDGGVDEAMRLAKLKEVKPYFSGLSRISGTPAPRGDRALDDYFLITLIEPRSGGLMSIMVGRDLPPIPQTVTGRVFNYQTIQDLIERSDKMFELIRTEMGKKRNPLEKKPEYTDGDN